MQAELRAAGNRSVPQGSQKSVLLAPGSQRMPLEKEGTVIFCP